MLWDLLLTSKVPHLNMGRIELASQSPTVVHPEMKQHPEISFSDTEFVTSLREVEWKSKAAYSHPAWST